MTFVDNATVSYSNPVRQTLFTFEDAKSGASKAAAAAEAIKRIFPSAVSRPSLLILVREVVACMFGLAYRSLVSIFGRCELARSHRSIVKKLIVQPVLI